MPPFATIVTVPVKILVNKTLCLSRLDFGLPFRRLEAAPESSPLRVRFLFFFDDWELQNFFLCVFSSYGLWPDLLKGVLPEGVSLTEWALPNSYIVVASIGGTYFPRKVTIILVVEVRQAVMRIFGFLTFHGRDGA